MLINCNANEVEQLPCCDSSKSSGDVSPTSESSGDASSNSTESTKDRKELILSVWSNIFYFTGSGLYIVTAMVDWKWLITLEKIDYDYYHDYYKGEGLVHFELSTYTYLSVLATIFWILSASLAFSSIMQRMKSLEKSIWHRDILSGMFAALAFGIGACLDLLACLLVGNVMNLVARISIVSANMYLLSALPSVYGNSMCKCHATERRLVLIGDWLFLIAASIDVLMRWLWDPEIIIINNNILYGGNVFSSFLWFVDAVIYLAADLQDCGYLPSIKRQCKKSKNVSVEEVIDVPVCINTTLKGVLS